MIPPTYYLLLDFGRAGRESIINWEDSSRERVILDILRGDYGGTLIEVHCIEREPNGTGSWENVTEEIARDVWDRLDDKPSEALTEFLESSLGLVRGIS